MSDTPTEPMPHVTIYTDGGAKPNPDGPGGWAAVLLSGPHERAISGGEPSTTNNRMELMAAIMALETLKNPSVVTLYTDSQYLRTGITEWIANWVRKGWKTASGGAVKNQDLWQRLDATAKRHRMTWRWVKAHDGHPMNERVDAMATAAREAIARGPRRSA